MKCYSCPECHADVPFADINVGADVALCRSCGSRFHVIDLIEVGDEADESRLLSEPPPKHVKVVRELDDVSGKVEVRYNKIDKAIFFLIPFALVWSGGSLGGIYGSQIARHAFDWRASLFGIPFLLGTILLFSIILSMLFSKRRLVLEHGHGTYSAKVFGIGKTKQFELNHETGISKEESWQSRRHVTMICQIKVKNGNKSETVCGGWDDDAIDYALVMLKRHRV